jgi:NAD(P) transhydrogenase subunit alpha
MNPPRMKIFAPKETRPGETRASLSPDSAARLISLGAEVWMEIGLGRASGHVDEEYTAKGVRITADPLVALRDADLVLFVNRPVDAAGMKEGAALAGFLDPFNSFSFLKDCATRKVDAIALEMVPRTTLAQKMDALSSQASLAGYVAVLLAAESSVKILPMMMTPAGTLRPSKVFVIGAGVAGLQAIATARRLGAQVEAFDTRPAGQENARSLGAKIVDIDLGETGQTAGGYAKELTPEQLARQRQAMADACARADIVITTAQLFGRKAPILIGRDVLARMARGSVVVDLAIDTGGNVEGAQLDREIDVEGVKVIGHGALARRVPRHATQVYAANLANLVEHFWDKAAGRMDLTRNEEILQGCLLTRGGAVVHPQFKDKS